MKRQPRNKQNNALNNSRSLRIESLEDRKLMTVAAEMVQWDQHLWHQMLTGGDEMMDARAIGGANAMRGCVTVNDKAVEVVVTWRGMDETVDGAVGGTAAQCGQADARRRSVRIATTIVEGI